MPEFHSLFNIEQPAMSSPLIAEVTSVVDVFNGDNGCFFTARVIDEGAGLWKKYKVAITASQEKLSITDQIDQLEAHLSNIYDDPEMKIDRQVSVGRNGNDLIIKEGLTAIVLSLFPISSAY